MDEMRRMCVDVGANEDSGEVGQKPAINHVPGGISVDTNENRGYRPRLLSTDSCAISIASAIEISSSASPLLKVHSETKGQNL
jgi:hypothetical protein